MRAEGEPSLASLAGRAAMACGWRAGATRGAARCCERCQAQGGRMRSQRLDRDRDVRPGAPGRRAASGEPVVRRGRARVRDRSWPAGSGALRRGCRAAGGRGGAAGAALRVEKCPARPDSVRFVRQKCPVWPDTFGRICPVWPDSSGVGVRSGVTVSRAQMPEPLPPGGPVPVPPDPDLPVPVEEPPGGLPVPGDPAPPPLQLG